MVTTFSWSFISSFGGLLFHLLDLRFVPTVKELQNLIFKIKGGTNLLISENFYLDNEDDNDHPLCQHLLEPSKLGTEG